MAVRKQDIKGPVLRKEAVTVEAFGGDVIVRALKLSERLALRQQAADAAKAGNANFLVTALLAVSVVDADGAPVFTADEWDEWGAAHEADATTLFNTAFRLAGFDADARSGN